MIYNQHYDIQQQTFLEDLGSSAALSTVGYFDTLARSNQNTVLRTPDMGATTSADLPYLRGARILDVTVLSPL